MHIYNAPSVNQKAPKDRTHTWSQIGQIEKPFPGDPGPDKFGFWFNYFWAEAASKPGLTEAEKSKLCEVFLKVFSGNAGVYRPFADFDQKEDSFKENILRQILLIGFRRVALEPPRVSAVRGAGGRIIAPSVLSAVDGPTLNWEHAVILDTQVYRGLYGKVPIGFRADTRSYDDLVQSNGFNARARQNGWIHKAYALDQRWNPFHNPVYSQSMFLRLGSKNKDACLQTVVSTGANFRDVAHFPILNDYALNFCAKSASGEPLALKPAEMWTESDIQLAAGDRMKVRAVKGSGPGVDHLEKDNHFHVFHTLGLKGFNTADHFGGVDKFPERSMQSVPLANLLADVHFVQKWWYSPDERQIVLYDLAFSPIRWVPSEQVVEALLGESGKQAVEAVINKEIMAARTRQQDVIPYGQAYKTYQSQKAFLLTEQEKLQIYSELKGYMEPLRSPPKRYAPNMKNEVAHVLSKLPNLKPKIDKLDPAGWSALRKEASRLAGWV